MYQKYCKRLIDLVLSLLALIVLAVPLLLLMLLVRVDSPGKPVFAQIRVGQHGRLFTIYKLRTMKTTAPKSVATGELQEAHAYITRLGAFLRKSSLDELLQFVNILKGDMSLVGPRPLVPEEKSVHEERFEKGVYRVRPGVTGWAQINGRDQVQPGMKADLDAYYAEHVSFGLDVRIVAKTVLYVVTGRGIQEGAAAPCETPEAAGSPAEEEIDA